MVYLSQNFRRFLLLFSWIILLGTGFWRLLVYSNTPGLPAQGSVRWPTASGLAQSSELPTLLLFAHPHCPCSEASIGELERLMPHIKDKVKVYAVFFKPENKPESWAKEALWKKAQSIPGVETILDDNGFESARFGAQTSGQTFLYDSKGTLVFRGGITSARGHMGDSDGRNSILQFVATGTASLFSTPVFGCSLKNPERAIIGDPR